VSDAYEALEADLRAGPTATAMLERRSGLPVRARVIATASPPGAAPREITGEGPIAYRRVQLVAGEAVLSDADNWYLPARLTPAMRDALAETDIPFGAVIAPLGPRRELLSMARVTEGPHALEVHALVRAADGTLLAEVVEHYARELLNLS
jgi:chorismate-pyruvate lyase